MGVADALIVGGACFAAYLLRFHSPAAARLLPVKFVVPDPVAYGVISLVLTLSWIFLLWHEGLYRSSLCYLRSPGDELRVVLWAGLRALALVMVASFLFHSLVISRVFVLMAFGIAMGLVLWLRVFFGYLLQGLASKDVLLESYALLGTGSTSHQILQRLGTLGPLSKVTGFIRLASIESGGSDRIADLPVLGDTNDIEKIIEERHITGVIFASNGYNIDTDPAVREALIRTVNCCEARGMPFYMIPDALNVAVRRNEVGSCCGYPVIELRDAAVHPLYGAAKRVIDVLVAATGLVVGMPVWLIVAAVVKRTSSGPVLFIQERVNRQGRVFRMLKFRTMVEDAPERLGDLVDLDSLPEPVFKIQSDPRVTSVGRFLRRTGLDEVPQLFNVLTGDMSLVGPRPEQVELVARYDAWQRRRLKARPGITGYQQVMSRGEPSLALRIHYDLHYLKHQSLLFDLFILWKTLVVIVKGDGIT